MGGAELIPRHEDWPTRLNAAIDAARQRPFDWEQHNCATFAADCVHAMTGVALHSHFAALHEDMRTAVRSSEQLENEVAIVLWDCARVLPAYAQRGDVVLVRNAGRVAIGICCGVSVASVGEKGVEFLAMREALCAWRV